MVAFHHPDFDESRPFDPRLRRDPHEEACRP
jgi:hypothetical protein